ncbi:MAG: hemagglutinin repeat-containing protein [Desulfovibrio sp.]|jgi:filamentous hemagglutinin|nr:hemagglutinin repeat-containing protein [Desulfovibrio sp.]
MAEQTATGNILALSGQNFSSWSSSRSSGNILGGSAKASGASSLTQVASNLLGTNVTLDAGQNVTLQASNLAAANDAALIARGGDIQLLDAQNVTSSWSKSSRTGFGLGGGGSFLSFYGTESKKQSSMSSASAGSQVATNSGVSIAAGRDVVMVGARVAAGGDLGVSAGRDLNVLAGENTTYSASEKKSQGFGVGALLSLEKIDLFAGYQTMASGLRERSRTVSASALSAGNDVNLQAGNNINVEAGRLAAGHDVSLQAGNDVNLLQGEDVRQADAYKSQLRAGLNLTLEQNLTSNAVNAYNLGRSAVDGSQGAADSALSGVNAAKSAAGLVNSEAKAALTLGVSGSRSTSSETERDAVPTEIRAGHDASILAGNDITMEGALLSAGNDALLAAGRDINIFAATSTASGSSSSSSFSAGAGIGAQASATSRSVGLTANASVGLQEAEGKSVKRQNAEITAGNRLTTISGRDTTLAGANLLGNEVDMRVGRDLRVESVRDRSRSSSHSSSANVSGTVGFGGGSVSGKANFGTAEGESDLIGRQTSVIGISGVNIYTENNTHIKGAIIAALNDNLVLNTGTLSFEDMTGRRTSSSWSMGITGSWSPDKPDAADAKDKTPQPDRPAWVQNLVNKQAELNDQWEGFKKDVIFAPGAFSYADSLTEQIARATVGPGTIIVRNNPGMDLSGLNRDSSLALSMETLRDTNFTLDPLFGYVDEPLNITGKIGDGYDFMKDPGGSIRIKWDSFVKGLKKTWGINNNTRKP